MGVVAQASSSSEVAVTETLIVGLMLVAALVSIAVKRLRVPYTVALVVVGFALGAANVFTNISLTPDLILLGFLPPLLFEGSINMDLENLVLRWRQVATLALGGTLISAAFISAPLIPVPGVPAELAIVLGVMLAATDPVSVLAVFKEHGVATGLRTLVEGESIFNDALAIVLYLIAVDAAFGDEAVTFVDGLTEFGREVVIGVGAGALVGFVAHRLMASLDDHLVEITLSLVTAYGAYLLADNLNGSGVMAVVGAGLLIGNYGERFAMSAGSRIALLEFWEVLAFIANSALFLVIGLQFDPSELRGRTLVATGVAILGMLVGRAVTAYGLLQIFRRSRTAPIPHAWWTAVFWGGLRGSVPIALALGLPERQFAGIDAVSMVFGVVLFSLVIQGLTFKPVLDRLGLTSKSDELTRYEDLLAKSVALRAARTELTTMRRSGEIVPSLFSEIDADLETEIATVEAALAELSRDATAVRQRQFRLLGRRMAASQKAALAQAARTGRVGESVARSMSKEIQGALEEREIADWAGEPMDRRPWWSRYRDE